MRLGLFSISYAGLWGQASLDLRSFIRRAADLGFDSVMLAGKRPHLSPLDIEESMMADLQRELKASGIRCDVIAAYVDLGATIAAEVPLAEMQVAYVESLCRMAARLGAGIVRVFTAYECAGQNPQTIWQRVVVVLREMCDRAAKHGVTIAIQNHHDLALDTLSLLDLLQEIDRSNCKLGFDAWSPALRGEDLYQAAQNAAPHTAITTNADYVRVPRYRYRPELVNYEVVSPDLVRAVPFGRGFIDYTSFFRGLMDGGFDGIANYEMCSPVRGGGDLSNLDSCARTYVTWMRERILK